MAVSMKPWNVEVDELWLFQRNHRMLNFKDYGSKIGWKFVYQKLKFQDALMTDDPISQKSALI